jgi:hypothetical protein
VCCRRRAVAAVGCLRLVCTQDCSPRCPRASGAHVARREGATVAVHARRNHPVISCPPAMTSVMFLQKQYIVAGSRRGRRARWKRATRESVEIELMGLQRAVGAYLGCGETFPVGGFGEEEFGLVRPCSPGLSIRPQQSEHPTQLAQMLGHARHGEDTRGRARDRCRGTRGAARADAGALRCRGTRGAASARGRCRGTRGAARAREGMRCAATRRGPVRTARAGNRVLSAWVVASRAQSAAGFVFMTHHPSGGLSGYAGVFGEARLNSWKGKYGSNGRRTPVRGRMCAPAVCVQSSLAAAAAGAWH